MSQSKDSYTVCAELVAKVLQVDTKVGDAVLATDVLVLLDSMKMEIPVLADRAGLVIELFVSIGSTVAAGDPIARIALAAGHLRP